MSPELRRALSPVERWYWIADQVSPLNVVARVHLRGHIAAGLLERAAGGSRRRTSVAAGVDRIGRRRNERGFRALRRAPARSAG